MSRSTTRSVGRKRALGRVLIAALSAAALYACRGFTAYNVGEIDYESPQRPAAIIVADPQVYARASLINDRRRETEYLQQVLDASDDVEFSPQITRDLRTVEALSLSLGIARGATVDNSVEANYLTQEIEVTRRQAQLTVLQKQLEGLQSAPAPQAVVPPLDLSGGGSSGDGSTSPASPLMPDLSSMQTSIKAIQDELATLKATGGATAPTNTYGDFADPRSEFADRQAYRRDIRAAVSEAQLDDVHDVGGNALYRLQFQVTVLPPNGSTRQWGAAQLVVKPPRLSKNDIASAYYQWLAYISGEINVEFVGRGEMYEDHNYDYDRYIIELGRRRLFNVIDLFNVENGDFYCFEHRTAGALQLETLEDPATYRAEGGEPEITLLGTYPVPPALIDVATECSPYSTDQTLRSMFTRALSRDKVNVVLSLIEQSSLTSSSNRRGATSTRVAPADRSQTVIDPQEFVPIEFCQAIVDVLERDNCGANRSPFTFTAAGGRATTDQSDSDRLYAVRSYSVLPTELTQRLGITTEASQSLQTALALGYQLSARSRAGFDAGFLSQSDARAQALARQPMVVGYAGTQPNSAQSVGTGFFGWLFGPEFVVEDSRNLALQQPVRTYGVSADISFPGWWAYLGLDVSTAWVSNWSDGSILSSASNAATSAVQKNVTLPVSAATYESLTNFIAAQQYGPQFSQIFVGNVTPTAIPACAQTITFQISGANIWRAESVFLGGARATSVSVLPNMKGIAATFNLAGVYGTPVNSSSMVQAVPLIVSAGHGVAARKAVYIIGSRQVANGAVSCQSPILVPTDYEWVEPTIMSFSPAEVCADATQVPLLIHGIAIDHDAGATSEHFVGVRGGEDSDSNRALITLKLREGAKLVAGTVEHIVIASEFAAIGAVRLPVRNCQTPTSPSPTPRAVLVTPSVKSAKDQDVALRVRVPASYYQLVVSIRRKTPTDDAAWTDSAPITAPAGEDVAIAAKVDASEIKVGEKIEVVVRVRSRPGVDWQQIQSDKLLDVTS
jgi:hypothetical protein